MKKDISFPMGFTLNFDIIYTILCDYSEKAKIVSYSKNIDILGASFYPCGGELDPNCIYITHAEQLPQNLTEVENHSFIVIGELQASGNKTSVGIISMPENTNPADISNLLTKELIRCSAIERKLNEVVNGVGGLKDLCMQISEFTGKSVHIHDEFYYILASSNYPKAYANFTYNPATNMYMQSVDLLNKFMLSAAYRRTMNTVGGQLWESDYDNSSSIYANIWINNEYKGRLIIRSDPSECKPIHLHEATYFAKMIKLVMMRGYTQDYMFANPIKNYLIGVLNGNTPDDKILERGIISLNWNIRDEYVCGILTLSEDTVSPMSVFSICNNIETCIQGSWTSYHQKHIYVIINLTKGENNIAQIRMDLATMVRDCLLRIGFSNKFSSIFKLPIFLKQAEIALVYEQLKVAPSWFSEFKDHVISYWMKNGFGELGKEGICSNSLQILKEYDKENNTDLFETLKTYLHYERNGIVTSKLLKIHRSTLPHRLSRIEKLTGDNLDDYKTRLHLNMSFVMMLDLEE